MPFTEKENALPEIETVCSEKLIVPTEGFEMPSKFDIPCVFTTGMIKYNGDLLLSYGAADENVGLMCVDFEKLMKKLNRM